MIKPIISVIVPVYNVEKFIQKSITSLLNQSFKEFEVLIVDDGSQDNSIAIAKQTVNADERFIFLEKENSGAGGARNYGIKRAKGQYLSFLDSDDYFDDTFLEKMIIKMKQEGADICICDIALVKENDEFIKTIKNKYSQSITGKAASIDNLQAKSISSSPSDKLYKKELFSDIKYPEDLYYEDMAIIYKLFLHSNRVAFVNEPLFYYVQRQGSTMHGYSQKRMDDRFILMDDIKEYIQLNNLLNKYKRAFTICYLLNIPLAGTLMIARYSSDYAKDISDFLHKTNSHSYYFSVKNIFLLRKYHFKKMLALFLLKVNVRVFRYFLLKEKSKEL